MLTVKELKEFLLDCPDDAVVYIEADHGQTPEQASYVSVCFQIITEDDYYGEDLPWTDPAKVISLNHIQALKIM